MTPNPLHWYWSHINRELIPIRGLVQWSQLLAYRPGYSHYGLVNFMPTWGFALWIELLSYMYQSRTLHLGGSCLHIIPGLGTIGRVAFIPVWGFAPWEKLLTYHSGALYYRKRCSHTNPCFNQPGHPCSLIRVFTVITVDSEIFARILFMRVTLKDILVMWKIRD